MIKQVLIRSKRWAHAFMRGQSLEDYLGVDATIDFSPPHALISINDPGYAKAKYVFANYLQRNTDERTKARLYFFEDSSFNPEEDYPGEGLFNKSHANSIISFIEELVKSEYEYTLIVHCFAGICRSGAVGAFAAELAQLPRNEFCRLNSQILPNASIHAKLMRVYLGQ
jgi:predicted protein tyrosine phosphatase